MIGYGYRLWIIGYGLFVMDHWLWIIGYRLLVMGYRLWVISLWVFLFCFLAIALVIRYGLWVMGDGFIRVVLMLIAVSSIYISC